jgi:cytochrome c6
MARSAGLLLAASVALPLAAAAEDARFALGREVFLERAEPRCPVCHTLAEAGASGEIGPNLDALAPDAERVRLAVTEGVGPMRPYTGLSEEEVDALAHYVATAAGG